MPAQTSLGFSTKKLCPDLRIAEDGTAAVVVFWLPSSGIATRISIKSSSGSSELDSAAMSCVAKLRFAPATRLGDGESIDSWQQFALRWAREGNAPESRTPAVGGRQTPDATTDSSATRTASDGGHGEPAGAPAGSVTVHVCADETGRLKQEPTIVRSSGKEALDQAALHIAAAGSAYYRPEAGPGGSSASGCAQLVIRFEPK
jgi:TonB family protein